MFRLRPFVYFRHLKKQDMTSSKNGIMDNEDLPPSSGWASILIWNKYATNSGLITSTCMAISYNNNYLHGFLINESIL